MEVFTRTDSWWKKILELWDETITPQLGRPKEMNGDI